MAETSEGRKPVNLSPRTQRAVQTVIARLRQAYPACPEEAAFDAAIVWSRRCPPKEQEREARIVHIDALRDALIEAVRAKLAGQGGAASSRIAARARETLESWKAASKD